jgi:hypothetical protein
LSVSFSFQGTTLWKTRTVLEKCLLVLTATLLLLVFVFGMLLSTTGRGEPALHVLHVGPHTAGERRSIMPVITDWQPGLCHQEEQGYSLPSHPQEPLGLPSNLSNWLYCQDPLPLSNTDSVCARNLNCAFPVCLGVVLRHRDKFTFYLHYNCYHCCYHYCCSLPFLFPAISICISHHLPRNMEE